EILPFNPFVWQLSAIILLVGAFIGVWGSVMSVRKFLKVYREKGRECKVSRVFYTVIVSILTISLLIPTSNSSAESIEDYKQKIEGLEEEKGSLNDKKDKVKEEKDTVQKEKGTNKKEKNTDEAKKKKKKKKKKNKKKKKKKKKKKTKIRKRTKEENHKKSR